jgi:predicted CopG family antitoxin
MYASDENKIETQTQEDKRITTVRIRKDTLQMLKERGRKGESYDAIIRKLLTRRRS